jgi:predicted DNA-binding transcriptional regulator YafY
MNRLDRLVATVLLLQSKRLIRAEDIAERFDVSVRTVYRDIQALCEAGVPIAGEAGVGYSLIAGYSLPPVMFTDDEASALLIGGEFVRQMTDEHLYRHVESALMKIRAVLPNDKKDYLERLQRSIAIFTRPQAYQSEVADDVMRAIQQAIVRQTVLSVKYETRAGVVSARDIEPFNLIYYGSNWHLIAYCRLRKEIRDFRADRILQIVSRSERFILPEGYTLMGYLQQQYQLQHPVQVVARFSQSVAQGLSQKYYYGFVEEESTPEGIVMTFIVPSMEWIGRWLLSFGTAVCVLSPVSLREFMREQACAVAALYSSALDAGANVEEESASHIAERATESRVDALLLN